MKNSSQYLLQSQVANPLQQETSACTEHDSGGALPNSPHPPPPSPSPLPRRGRPRSARDKPTLCDTVVFSCKRDRGIFGTMDTPEGTGPCIRYFTCKRVLCFSSLVSRNEANVLVAYLIYTYSDHR